MACSISIDDVRGILTGGRLTAISVTGTAIECGHVRIAIRCAAMLSSFSGVASVTGGLWSTEFVATGPVQCRCGEHIEVRATCEEDPLCPPALFSGNLNCPEPPPVCPEIDWGRLILGECDDTGTRTVTVSATFDLGVAGDVEGRITSGGVEIGRGRGASPLTVAGTGTLPPGARLRAEVVNPPGCRGYYYPEIPACEACPDVGRIEVRVNPVCIDGRRAVHFTAPVTPPSGGSSTVYYQYDDGSESHRTTFGDSGTLEESHDFTPGRHTVFVRVEGMPDCGPFEMKFVAPACPRCTVHFAEEVVAPCAAEGDTSPRSVRLSATVGEDTPGILYTAVMRLGRDGSGRVLESVADRPAPVTLTHDEPFPVGTHTYSIQIDGCDPQISDFTVAPCEELPPPPPPPPRDGGGESFGCALLRILAATLFAVAAIAAILLACIPLPILVYVAFGALVAAAFLLFFYSFCPRKTCNWFLLLSTEVVFGIGIGLSILSHCCRPLLSDLPLMIFAIGITPFIGWWHNCKVSLCDAIREFATFLVAMIAATLLLFIVPGLFACLNPRFLAMWGLTAGGLWGSYIIFCRE